MTKITARDIPLRGDVLAEALALRPDINRRGCYRTAASEANEFMRDGMGREDAIWQATEMVEAVLRHIVASTKPWARDPEMQSAFETAQCRYENLIGITDPDDGDDVAAMRAHLDRDKVKYAHMMKKTPLPEGGDELSLYDDDDAVAFIAEATGHPEQTCRDWLAYGGTEKILVAAVSEHPTTS